MQIIHHLLNTSQAFFEPLQAADNGVFKNVKIAKVFGYFLEIFRNAID